MLARRVVQFTYRLQGVGRLVPAVRMNCPMSAKTTEASVPQKRPLTDVESLVEEKKPRSEYQRIKRRKYAILICYFGQGYLGLQRNPQMKTIEEDLMKAWLKAGIITDDIYENPKSIEFQRAARTDKGVSAIRQVLSAKLPLNVSKEAVNEHLPDQIRMVDLKRATKGFNCKGNADARTYSYTMPTFALAPKDLEVTSDYRVPESVIDRTNEVLKSYLGTHNYHNFTSKRSFSDPSNNRYMMQIFCKGPVVCEGWEFVTIYVKGQSFMLHQIRKMVGLAIAIVKGLAPDTVITKAWGEEKLDIPIAPGLGLVLEEVHYDRYNQRYGNDGMHKAIEWSNVELILEEFKNKFVLTSIVKTEKEENSMKNWLNSLSLHTFDVRDVHRLQPNADKDATRIANELRPNEKNGTCEINDNDNEKNEPIREVII